MSLPAGEEKGESPTDIPAPGNSLAKGGAEKQRSRKAVVGKGYRGTLGPHGKRFLQVNCKLPVCPLGVISIVLNLKNDLIDFSFP